MSVSSPSLRAKIAFLLIFVFIPPALLSAVQRKSPPDRASAAASRPSELAHAQALLQAGRLVEAKTSILDYLRSHPSSIDGFNLLGIICSTQRDYPAALEALQHALKLNPESTKTHNNLGNLYAAQGRAALAESQFRKVLAIAPSDRDANYNLALLLLANGKPAAAIPLLQRVRPASLESRLNLVRACLRSRRTSEGLRLARQISAENKNDVRWHFTLGLLLGSEKQYGLAALELEKANALRPETFEILFNLGQVYLRANERAKAELVLNRALKLKPQSAETMYLLAQALSEESRPLDALELLARARKLAPNNPDILFLMARISMTQNYYEDAIPLLQSGIKMAPRRADLHAALGQSYFLSGKTDKAIEEFKQLVALDRSARSYAFLGLAYRRLGRFQEARASFEEGLRQDPQNAPCLFNLGMIDELQGDTASAKRKFEQTLRFNPDFSEALLELANLRTREKMFSEAAALLRRYLKVTHGAGEGYYRLAMVERRLHQTAAAQRDLQVFQTLSKGASSGPQPYQHLFDYLNNRAQLSSERRTQLDVQELTAQIHKHPGQPQDLYLLAQAYLRLGKGEEALQTVAQLDQLSAGDYRMQTGVGVLLAQHHLYEQAISHFQNALKTNSESDEIKFDLTDAYFRAGMYADALRAFQEISPSGQQDDSSLSLLGDIYAHLGESAKSIAIFRDAIARNPDNDQCYLSLMLVQLRAGDVASAEQTLRKGLGRIPASGKILWGLGLISALQGNTSVAAQQLERAVDLLPEWAGGYSTLGLFYYLTGQMDKAREVLDRFKGSNAGGLNVQRIEAILSNAPANSASPSGALPMEARQQLLQFALVIADRTL